LFRRRARRRLKSKGFGVRDKTPFQWVKNIFVGAPRSLSDDRLFHKVSLVALFAWVGLGADGLSSSCYGPEEAFKALGPHHALAPFVALGAVLTIAVLCVSYSQIIELFPGGGGGYLVASKLLSPTAGVISGCALLVDYVLTIALSISSGADALFSLLPARWLAWKLPVALGATGILTLLNLRGVRESVAVWIPIFFAFLVTHACAIGYAFFTHAFDVTTVVAETGRDLGAARAELGLVGVFLLLIRAYSVGAGTYTGIEAVSNGLPILREPRVATGKRTMAYMGASLSLTVSGLFVAYLLYQVEPESGKTLNAVVMGHVTSTWAPAFGKSFVWVTMTSAAALLFIAAQTGFLDGPRVLANMAVDRWFPSRFASLSDRFVAQNGVLLMGSAALVLIAATGGHVGFLVVLYSINVFITFSLSQAGMVRHWWTHRVKSTWKRKLTINGIGLALTLFILLMLSVTKFHQGGWITLFITGLLVGVAFWVRRHYRGVIRDLTRLDDLARLFDKDPAGHVAPAEDAREPFDPKAKTAVVLVNGFNGLGVHTLLTVYRMFPGVFRNYVFICAGSVDTGTFKGSVEIERLREHIEKEAGRYVNRMRQLGFHSEAVTQIGTDVIETLSELAETVSQRYPQSVFFGGQLVFAEDTWTLRVLHNYVVFALQRRLFRQGVPFLILPIRV
jgi:amino acid transporter